MSLRIPSSRMPSSTLYDKVVHVHLLRIPLDLDGMCLAVDIIEDHDIHLHGSVPGLIASDLRVCPLLPDPGSEIILQHTATYPSIPAKADLYRNMI